MRRKHEDDNRELDSAPPAQLTTQAIVSAPSPCDIMASFQARTRHRRNNASVTFDRIDPETARIIDYDICPLTDFNGAGLLYFANFQSIMDRCEWSIFPEWQNHKMAIQTRSISYFGNVNSNDRLSLNFVPLSCANDSRQLECFVFRRSDNALIAWASIVRGAKQARLDAGLYSHPHESRANIASNASA